MWHNDGITLVPTVSVGTRTGHSREGMHSHAERTAIKLRQNVGWVEERNPTFSSICRVTLPLTRPTNDKCS